MLGRSIKRGLLEAGQRVSGHGRPVRGHRDELGHGFDEVVSESSLPPEGKVLSVLLVNILLALGLARVRVGKRPLLLQCPRHVAVAA